MQPVYSDTITKLFKEKGVNEICECCGKGDWILHNDFSALVQQTSTQPGIFSFPVVAIECRNCGNVRFFARGRLGIKEPVEKGRS